MKADDREHIAPSMCYAYAALTEGAVFKRQHHAVVFAALDGLVGVSEI